MSKKQPTQYELIDMYLDKYKVITPAKLAGVPFKNGFFGSNITVRCRELRLKGILGSTRLIGKDGKLERFVSFFKLTK